MQILEQNIKNAIARRNGTRTFHKPCVDMILDIDRLNFPDSAKVTSMMTIFNRKLAYSAQISQTAHGSFSNPEIILSSLNLSKTGNAPHRG